MLSAFCVRRHLAVISVVCFSIAEYRGQQSPFFQEEFPKLATGGGEEKCADPPKKEEESKESQYGPGPSLRPQSRNLIAQCSPTCITSYVIRHCGDSF